MIDEVLCLEDIILTCSDAMGQFFMIQWHLGRKSNEIENLLKTPYGIGNYILKQQIELSDVSFKTIIDEFWGLLYQMKSFRTKVYEMAEEHLLAIDDYSLIMAKII